METSQLVLRPLVGSGDGDQSRVLRFRQAPSTGNDVTLVKGTDSAGSVVIALNEGLYSVSATVRFQCTDDQGTISNGWSLTLNSFAQRDAAGTAPLDAVLATALFPEPGAHEAQREPFVTLSWVGFLKQGDELRVESERPKPRLYQGVTEDRFCFLRVVKLSKTPIE